MMGELFPSLEQELMSFELYGIQINSLWVSSRHRAIVIYVYVALLYTHGAHVNSVYFVQFCN